MLLGDLTLPFHVSPHLFDHLSQVQTSMPSPTPVEASVESHFLEGLGRPRWGNGWGCNSYGHGSEITLTPEQYRSPLHCVFRT